MHLNSLPNLTTGKLKTSKTYQTPDTLLHVLELPPGPACREGNCYDDRGARSTLGKECSTNGTDSILDSGPHEIGSVISLWIVGESLCVCQAPPRSPALRRVFVVSAFITDAFVLACPPSGRN